MARDNDNGNDHSLSQPSVHKALTCPEGQSSQASARLSSRERFGFLPNSVPFDTTGLLGILLTTCDGVRTTEVASQKTRQSTRCCVLHTHVSGTMRSLCTGAECAAAAGKTPLVALAARYNSHLGSLESFRFRRSCAGPRVVPR